MIPLETEKIKIALVKEELGWDKIDILNQAKKHRIMEFT